MSSSAKTLLKWGLLILIFLAIWQILSPPRGAHDPDPAPTGYSWAITLGLAAVVLSVVLGLRRFVRAAAAHRGARLGAAAHLEALRFDEAEQAVAPVLKSRLGAFRRPGHLQHAEIAARRGDRDAALARIAPAIEEPVGRLFAGRERRVIVNARALRAFLRASAGDEAGAREDIAAVRAAEDVEPTLLARAALAEAMLLDRKGDRAALREIVDRSRALWLSACPRHERALARAYEAMLDAGAAPVYRQKASLGGEASADDAVAAWVAKMAPNAAPFVRTPPRGEGAARGAVDAGAPSDEARRKIEAARPVLASKQSTRTFLIWVGLILLFLFLWQVKVDWVVPALTLLATGGIAVWIVRARLRHRADERRLRAGIRAYGAGDLDRAAAELAFEPKAALQRAQAAHFRADIAIVRGAMGEALAETDRALAALAEAQGGRVAPPSPPAADGTVAWDYPRALASQRSLALAALGRADEARAEIAAANGFPNALAPLRVKLVEKLRVHDFEAAARIVERCPDDVLLGARDEVLFDLIRFVARSAARGEAEAARLRAELRRGGSLLAWIDAVAPGLLNAFEAAAAGMLPQKDPEPLAAPR
jgi:hypothetical protein